MFKGIEDILKYVNKNKPSIIFLTSKSGNGKTYLSNKLSDYIVLELDVIVRKIGKKFGIGEAPNYDSAFQIYKNKLPEKVTQNFVKQIRSFVIKNKSKKILIEGAISSPELLRRIFNDIEYTFIYLYPTSVSRYSNRLIHRYNKDVTESKKTLPFWSEMPEFKNSKELNNFMNKMAKQMKVQSADRYDMFKNAGFDILRVNV